MDKKYHFLQRNTLFQFFLSSIPATILMIVVVGMIFPTGVRGAPPVPDPVEFVWDGSESNLFSNDDNWVDGTAPGTNKNVEDINSITFNSGDSGDRIVVVDQGSGNPKVQPTGLLTINDTNTDNPSFTFDELTDGGFEYSLLGLDVGGTIFGFDNNSTGTQTFNVTIGMENSQSWESAGNVIFNDSVFSASNGENLTLSGSTGITFEFNEAVDNAFENRTGNVVTVIQDFDGTVEMNGVFYHSSIELKQGTFLLGGDNLISGGASTAANLNLQRRRNGHI